MNDAMVGIRQATFGDYEGIAAVLERNGLLPVRSREAWTALWQDNPAYTERQHKWAIGWVLESRRGEIVGSIANLPVAYEFEGRDMVAAASCAWAVDFDVRYYSLLLLKQLMSQNGVQFIISTTINERSEPAFRACHWSKVPVGRWDRSELWITNYSGFIQSVMQMKQMPMAGLVKYPLSAVLACRDRLRYSGSPRKRGDPEIQLCEAFDDRCDELWDELRQEKKNILLAVRSRKTLNWHFGSSMAHKRLWFVTASSGSRIRAYAVFEKHDSATHGLKRVRLIDCQGVNGSQGMLEAILEWALEKCRHEGIHALETTGCWLSGGYFPRINAPYARALSSWTYYYRPCDVKLAELLQNPSVWAPSSFDGDASL